MIPHNKPTLGADEILAAERVIRSGWVAKGVEVASFEDEIASFFGLPKHHVVAVGSGSAALFLAMWALRAKGKSVGVPSYSCASLLHAVKLAGGVPKFLDTDGVGPNLAWDQVRSTSADILLVASMFGIPATIPSDFSGHIIEDIAQSFGAQVDGKVIGLRGDLGVCSFSATKLFTSGGIGGAVVSVRRDLCDMVRDFIDFDGRDDELQRFNFQMTDLQAAVGRAQLRKLSDFLDKRRVLFDAYRDAGLPLLEGTALHDQPVRYRAVIRCNDPTAVIDDLAQGGIRAIIPVQENELLGAASRDLPNARFLAKTTVSLPLYPDLEIEVVERIATLVKKRL